MTTLDAAYAECRSVTKRSGTTYYWSTFVLPAVKRHHVWALYALCRTADDIVDSLDDRPAAERAAALADFGDALREAIDEGRADDAVLHAVAHTTRAFAIDPACYGRFLRSMTMDLTVDSYETWDDLLVYTDGSAAVIGEMMLPILEPSSSAALPHARDLGTAFQLTNFLRDVAEDLDRGRLYLPMEDVRRFGADPTARRADAAWVELMRFEIDRCRRLYESADVGIAMLPSASARCVRTARVLYAGILERIERAGYDVFAGRVRVPTTRKAFTALAALRPAG